MTHWKEIDYRITSLKITIQGLEASISELEIKNEEIDWYDGIWLLEESEPIYGLAFVAIQNYINSSVYDKFNNLEKQYLKYKLGEKIRNTGRTEIELIVSIANYFKHKDHPKSLSGETPKILNDFKLRFDKDVDIEASPIFKGLEMLNEEWDLTALVQIVEKWRKKLWQ